MSQELGTYIARILKEKKFSQIDLAKKSNLSASYISRLISGYRGSKRPSFDTMLKLAQGLELDVSELMKHSGWSFEYLDYSEGHRSPSWEVVLINDNDKEIISLSGEEAEKVKEYLAFLRSQKS